MKKKLQEPKSSSGLVFKFCVLRNEISILSDKDKDLRFMCLLWDNKVYFGLFGVFMFYISF